uniref:Uncharacterized protein n=1 Tax=viral metagenome TaxID=1070528 RepID=A0A6C0BN99_9ZZZZ
MPTNSRMISSTHHHSIDDINMTQLFNSRAITLYE